MSPLVAFLLGVGLMMFSIGCSAYVVLRWIENPLNIVHVLSGFFQGLSGRYPTLVVRDRLGVERELALQAVADAFLDLPDRPLPKASPKSSELPN